MNFHEYIIKCKKGTKGVLLSVLIYLGATVLSVVPLIILIPMNLASIAALLSFACFYFAHRFSSGLNKEFEYIFTEDTITVDVIKNASRRKRIISFSLEDTDIIAPVDDPQYKHLLEKKYDKVVNVISGSEHATLYFAVICAERRTLLKFEPPYQALKDLFKYAPSKIKIQD